MKGQAARARGGRTGEHGQAGSGRRKRSLPAAMEMLPTTAAEKEGLAAQVLADYEQFINPGLAHVFRFMGLDSVEWQARGALVTDIFGREFIDCAGGYGVFIHGYSHPRIVAAVKEQLEKMPLSSRVLLSKPAADLARLLAEVTPGDLQYSFFCNSGAESVEAALKFARMATGRTKIVSTVGGFHGKTMGALSASGREIYRRPFQPLVPGFVHVPYGDASALAAAVDGDTAAVILEPVQAEGGVHVPPDDYLPAARQLCDRFGALLIADEVQTGLGRTGKLFGCDHYGVVPDIMCLAKALGGGIVPIGATVARPPVWDFMYEHPLIHTSTFGGNPLACTAGVAAVQVVLEEKLAEQAAEKGELFMDGLRSIQEEYPSVIADVRGRGLLIGVEVTGEGAGGMLIAELISRNVLAVYTLNNQKVLRFEPPVVITKDQIGYVLEAMAAAVEKTAAVVDEL